MPVLVISDFLYLWNRFLQQEQQVLVLRAITPYFFNCAQNAIYVRSDWVQLSLLPERCLPLSRRRRRKTENDLLRFPSLSFSWSDLCCLQPWDSYGTKVTHSSLSCPLPVSLRRRHLAFVLQGHPQQQTSPTLLSSTDFYHISSLKCISLINTYFLLFLARNMDTVPLQKRGLLT